jgi:hypothetical protein
LAEAGRRGRVIAALLLAAAVVTLGVACSSSSPAKPTATATRPPAPTAFPEPTLVADVVTSPLKGYTATVPVDFHLRPNIATDSGARFPTDAFFGPASTGTVQPSISLTCYATVAGKTLENYRDDWATFIGAFSSTNIVTTETTVSGLRAFVFTYDQTLHGQADSATPVTTNDAVQKQDYIVVQDDCRWLIAVLTPPGQLDTYEPVVTSFLAGLKFSTRLN